MKKDLVSIIIVNFNGEKWLANCLKSIHKQTYKNFEIIIVDNASTDKSLQIINKNFPKVKLVINKKNFGFAKGNNIGFAKSNGKYILLLNSDTTIPKDFISKLLFGMKELKADVLQPKIVLMDNKKILDTAGSFWTDTTFLYHYGYGKKQNLKKYNKPYPVFSIKGAAVIIKREVINHIGLFDDTFWNYYEETDFCHRAWVAGYKIWYWPGTICYHAMGGTSLEHFNRSYIQFHNFKNKLCSIIKNFENKNVVINVLKYLFLNFVISIVWLVQGKSSSSLSLYKAFVWNMEQLPVTIKKRKKIQKSRKVKDKSIEILVKNNPRIEYYKLLLNDKVSLYED